ncbi:MAG: hypothetical protein L6R42_006177 [Xanthoria sp. 1 TBL-2021]|nr:MAG: hypothetical protein L6R42_006177 [Xanthoria sp. 1 TBL-2021]
MKLILLTLSFLFSIISAHFTLDFPPAREANEDDQGTFPCGGAAVSNSRTAWPLAGGSIQLTLGHARSAVQVLVALGNEPGSNFNAVLVPTVQEEGLGKFCFSGVKVPESLGAKDGDNATIQVVTDSHATGGLYNCADITFSSSNSSSSASQCTFGQGIRTAAYTGPANANGTESSSSATGSASGAATPSSTGSSTDASPSGAAGKREAGGVAVLGMLAAWTLWL